MKHTNDRPLTMDDLFCCTEAIAGQVPEVGSEALIASGCEVLTRVLVRTARERLWADSGSDSLSARVVTGLADFLSSGV
ncbi:hypothetical protein GLR75_004561 [Escherichia coli]|nr:hypothetical protein [Escherichia coli]